MRTRNRALGLIALTLLLVSNSPKAWADITQQLTIPLTDTNYDPTTGTLTGLDPMVFNQFTGSPSQLTGVDIKAEFITVNTFTLGFTTPLTITVSAVAPNPTTGQLEGPSITMTGPNGNSPLPSFQPTVQNLTGLSVTQTYGTQAGQTLPQTFGSSFPTNSPFYIAPQKTDQIFTNSYTSSSSDFSKFVGSGTLSFPIYATGISKFTTTSGNGSGGVVTQAEAIITITYHTVPVPEPSSVVLLGLGAGTLGLLLVRRGRRDGSEGMPV